MYYRYFRVYDSLSDYNNDNHGRTPQVVIVNEDESVHYQEIQYRNIIASQAYVYQREYDNVYFYREVPKSVNKYQCIMFPFDYTLTDLDCSSYTIAEIESFTDDSSNGGHLITHTLTPGETLYHDVPYLFKSPTATFTLYGHRNKFYNLQNSSEPVKIFESANGNGTLYKFYSIYTSPFVCPSSNTYYTMTTNGSFNWMNSGVSIPPYRWYFTITRVSSTSNSNNLLMGGLTYNPNSIAVEDDGSEDF